MNRCQHNQKITQFCVADGCTSKEACGCDLCMKRQHNHQGQSGLFSEDQVQNAIKKFTLENTVKPKCRLLQESIYNYFNQVKTELSTSLDLACKNIINQIGYPYLFANNHLSTYKRLKNKEYRKITQKEFRTFFEMAIRIEEKELAKEENRIYLAEIKSCSEAINQVEALVKGFQTAMKNYNNQFVHETLCFQKICEINRAIQGQSPFKNFKKTSEIKEKEVSYGKDAQRITLFNAPLDFIAIPKLESKNSDTKAEIKVKYVEKNDTQQPLPSPVLPSKNMRTRDVSLDKKMVKEHKFNPSQLHEERHRETQRSQSGLPHHKIESLKQELNYKEMEINEKKKLLMGIMKQNDNKFPFQRLQSLESSPTRLKMPQSIKKQQSDTRSANQSKSSRSSQDLTLQQHSKMIQNTKNYAFTKLPIAEDALPKKEQKAQIKKKLIIIPTQINKNGSSKPNEVDSPLYKKRRIQVSNDQRPFKDQSRQKHQPFYRKLQLQSKQSNKQVLQIKQNQEKSLALLLKSLHLSAQDAVVYLQASLKYADNNLSAAQYLSFIYLQLNRPKDCLNLCNKLLDKMENTTQQEVMSLNLNNNKAAAFNKLGRYSQAILILQRCLKNKQKDTLFKNLGDSYFSIGNYQKAILNYERCLKMNTVNDQCHYNLAVCLYLQESYQNAKTAVKRALQLNPKHQQYSQFESVIDGKLKPA